MTVRKLISRQALSMGTSVTIQIVTAQSETLASQKIGRVLALFHHIEAVCSRFDEDSELSRLCRQTGAPVHVSDILFELVRFALELSSLTNGMFDPTIGSRMASLGFKSHYLTGATITNEQLYDQNATYQDILLDERTRSIELTKPLLLDLGAIAKGFAIDLAAKELQGFEGFLVEAGGDLYAGGSNEEDEPWQVGIQHPQYSDQIIGTVRLSHAAICTSGGYERRHAKLADQHHLIVPQTGHSPNELLSCTAIAPHAMLADAFSTAAFILGPKAGYQLLHDNGLEGLFILPGLQLQSTPQFHLA